MCECPPVILQELIAQSARCAVDILWRPHPNVSLSLSLSLSAEILKSIPWRALQKVKKAFQRRYTVEDEEIETWLRNIIVLIPKKKVIDRLEGQTRGIFVQSVLAKCYCGCLTILLEMEWRNAEKRDKSWEEAHTFGFEEGRSATEISTAIRLMAAAARE